MITLRTFDKLLLVLGFLIVIGLFTLAYVIFQDGGQCVLDPLNYAINKNITINPYNFPLNP